MVKENHVMDEFILLPPPTKESLEIKELLDYTHNQIIENIAMSHQPQLASRRNSANEVKLMHLHKLKEFMGG
jgi:hypothetical protein